MIKTMKYLDEESVNNVRIYAQDMKDEAEEVHMFLIRLMEGSEKLSEETLGELKGFVMSVENSCDDILSEVE